MHEEAATRRSAAAPSTTAPTASTRTRSCATSTGAARAAPPAAASSASGRWSPQDKEIEVAPGVSFAAWTYNGRIPGPTLRAARASGCGSRSSTAPSTRTRSTSTASTRRRWTACRGLGAGQIEPGKTTVYEFDALPFGLHLYHCHVRPLAEHIAKGLYGAFLDRPEGGPRGRRRAGDGDERVRHELRPRERGLRRQHDRLRLHGRSRSRSRATSWCGSTSSTCSSTT